MSINILITSISRKVWLVNAFKEAIHRERVDGKVITVDINPLSAGLYVSDKYYIVPPLSDKNFISSILEICKKENIKLIIPTRDGELLEFAKNREKFKNIGTDIMVSGVDVIKTCNDKYRFYKFLIQNKIPTPKTYLPGEIDFSSIYYPVIIKSRYGSGGKGVFKAKTKEELEFFISYISDPLIQEFVEGKEYTIDLFSNFNGEVLTIVPRERVETFCGESYKGKTIKDSEIIEYAKVLAEKLQSIGHITIQCIKSKNGIKFIEVNPRFGGGAALGFKSGAHTPSFLIQLILGKEVKPQIGKYKEDLVMLRYTKDLFIVDDEIVV